MYPHAGVTGVDDAYLPLTSALSLGERESGRQHVAEGISCAGPKDGLGFPLSFGERAGVRGSGLHRQNAATVFLKPL